MIYGRTDERAALRSVVDRARGSRSGVVVVRGQPGAGKSTLLRDLFDYAVDGRLLIARGVESESELPFASLHQLLRPIERHIDDIAPPQARALRAALGAEHTSGNPFLVALAVLSLLAEVAERHRVLLCVIDDAHWIDEASARALVFVARRLEAERIAMVFAAREGDGSGFDAPDLSELRVEGLDQGSAMALIAEHSGMEAASDVCVRLVEQTDGNPLALVELATVLTPQQLSGHAALPERLPLTAGVERAFLDRVRRLSDEAQTLLVVAAAEDTGRLLTIAEAAGGLGVGAKAFDSAERSGLIRLRNMNLEFRHPLVRTAIYQGATSSERRRAHQALADVLTGDADIDRRVWHRALAAGESDESIADQLEQAAERARARGAFQAAATAMARAAELTVDGHRRAWRLFAAATDSWHVGQLMRAAEYLREAGEVATDPVLTADIDRLRAWIDLTVGSPTTAYELLVGAARRVIHFDRRRAIEMLKEAAETAATRSIAQMAHGEIELGAGIEPDDDVRTRVYHAMLLGFDRHWRGDLANALPALRDAIRLAEQSAVTDLLSAAGHASLYLGDDAVYRRMFTEVLARARVAGGVTDVVTSLQRLVLSEIHLGQWINAEATANEALRLAEASGQLALTGIPMAWLALLGALRGKPEQFEECARAADRICAAHPMGVLAVIADDIRLWARGIHELSAARPGAASASFAKLTHPAFSMIATLDRIEAAEQDGQRAASLAVLDELDDFAQHSGAAWAMARRDHCRALLEQGDDAERLFEQALNLHDQCQRPFDQARAELAYGEFLRRKRRRVDARVHLRTALGLFDELGATSWAKRASNELRASGETARKRDVSTTLQLTPQETQVARFVAQGLPNREIAARLFLSTRTVDYHLRKIFTKAGITSRTELARLPLD